MNKTNPARTAPKPGTLLGVAIKTDHTDKLTTSEDWPDEANEEGDNQMDDKDAKKKTFVTKEYGLKTRAKTKRKFKCGVCATELETVCDYNQHYLDNHPLTPCPHCPHLFSLLRTMAKHKYSHVELCLNAKHADKDLCLRVNMSHTTEFT